MPHTTQSTARETREMSRRDIIESLRRMTGRRTHHGDRRHLRRRLARIRRRAA